MFQVYCKVIQFYLCIYVSIYLSFFKFFFYYRLLHVIEFSSLCYTVGSLLFIIYIVMFIGSPQIPNLSLPPLLSPLVTVSLFSMSVSLFLFCK